MQKNRDSTYHIPWPMVPINAGSLPPISTPQTILHPEDKLFHGDRQRNLEARATLMGRERRGMVDTKGSSFREGGGACVGWNPAKKTKTCDNGLEQLIELF